MSGFDIYFPAIDYNFPMVFVKGTGDSTYLFGGDLKLNIRISDFFISKYLVTQRLWEYIMGNNPAAIKGSNRPVETVSFNDITNEEGILRKLNRNGLRVLGDGDIDRALHVSAHYFTESAREKITKAGGTVEVITL